jgi:hypothetical protein
MQLQDSLLLRWAPDACRGRPRMGAIKYLLTRDELHCTTPQVPRQKDVGERNGWLRGVRSATTSAASAQRWSLPGGEWADTPLSNTGGGSSPCAPLYQRDPKEAPPSEEPALPGGKEWRDAKRESYRRHQTTPKPPPTCALPTRQVKT